MKPLIFAAAFGLASASLAQDSYTIKLSPKVGEVTKYSAKATFDVFGTVIEASFTDVRTVQAVDSDSFTMVSAWEDFKVVMDGAEQEVPGMSTTTKYTLAGKLMELTGEMAMAETYRAGLVDSMIFSENPVKKGDKWSVDFAADSKKGTVAAKADYEIVAEEEIKGTKTFKIKAEYKETTGSAPASGSGHFWVNPANGQVVRAEREWKNVPNPQAPVPLSGKLVLELIAG
jgi:hypothetical protein